MPPLFDFNKKICYNYYRKKKGRWWYMKFEMEIKEDGVFINGEKIFSSDCFGSEEIGCAICDWINENQW